MLLYALLSFWRRSTARDKAALTTATRQFWWGLEEDVEVECVNIAELKARRDARVAAERLHKDEIASACRALVVDLVELARAEAEYKDRMRRDAALSRLLHVNRTVVDRYTRAQRDVATKTTNMGTQHERYSQRVNESIEAVREELRLLDEVATVSFPDHTSMSLLKICECVLKRSCTCRSLASRPKRSKNAKSCSSVSWKTWQHFLPACSKKTPPLFLNARQTRCVSTTMHTFPVFSNADSQVNVFPGDFAADTNGRA
jgi:hypothetical protein